MKSNELFDKACHLIPGGVNSPVRAFKGVGGAPVFFKEGKGAYLTDVEGKRYVDYVGSWGPMIVGHAHPTVLKAVSDTLANSLSFGAPSVLEIEMAEKITTLMPSIQKVRMVNSGTEATMTAIRLARGVTGRDKILKFNGCYHGHSDSLLVNAGSGLLTLGIPSSKGVLQDTAAHTLTAPFNNLDAVSDIFKRYGEEIACIIIEPVAGNMGCILPEEGYLQGLRAICDEAGSLLIFDEVMTGFRVALGGAQALYNVEPDITTLGKVIGGGLPVGALGGKAHIMNALAPEGDVYQAGTLSGNPISLAAGLATLKLIEAPGFYETLTTRTQQFVTQMQSLALDNNIPLSVSSVGGMFGFAFSEEKVLRSFDDIHASNQARFKQFYHAMLEEGIYFAPSAYEAGFMSSEHGEEEIALTLSACEKVFKTL
jgi:glutamate-1-semialdehyde 2,1-aminomutase